MNCSTFTTTSENQRVSIRPSWITTVADLGRIHGDECKLVGVVRDHNALDGKIDYGIASSADVTKLELQLGKRISELFEEGATIDSWVTAEEPIRLVDLKPLEVRHSVRLTPGTTPTVAIQRPGGHGEGCRHDYAILQERATTAREVFERQRCAAVALRRSFSIGDMKHRSDWPTWLPHWVRDEVRQNSRIWLELGNQPAPATPEIPPVIKEAAIFEPTPASPVTKGIVSRFMEVLS